MHWRWIAAAAVLAAVVIGYGALNERNDAAQTVQSTPPQPGYYLRDAVITQTQKDGRLGARVIADSIRQQPADDSIAIERVRLEYMQAPEREWLLTAQQAHAPADWSVVTFRGDVHLRPADDAKAFLRTEALAVDMQRHVAYSVDTPTTLHFGSHHMRARALSADLSSEKIQIESVQGRFDAP